MPDRHYSNYFLYTVTLTLTMWLSSGTLFPYAATLPHPVVEPICGYLMNWDNPQFEQVFYFLRGDPKEAWQETTLLRRILFPALAFFPMQLMGFVVGGIITSFLLHLVAGFTFIKYIGQSLDPHARRFLSLALGTFPGVAYFGPSPYSYACIVPFSLIGFLLLSRLDRGPHTLSSSTIIGLCTGTLCLGYDLTAYLLPMGCLLLVLRKMFLQAAVFSACSLIAPACWGLILARLFSIPLLNSNTEVYRALIDAYLHPMRISMTAWLPLLEKIPYVFVHNYVFSSFMILPLGALVFLAKRRLRGEGLFSRVEGVWLGVIFAVWLINNAAPPYPGWQLRGVFIARLYEPAFVALLTFVMRTRMVIPHPSDLLLWGSIVLGQATIVFGPWVGLTQWSANVYIDFYQHAERHVFAENLQIHGKYPLGTCPKILHQNSAGPKE